MRRDRLGEQPIDQHGDRGVTVYGYDPARVDVLHRLTREAVDGLAVIRSDDRAAGEAMRAVARTRETLEQGWIPFIDAIRTSTAMTAWRHTLGADPANRALAGGVRASTPASTWIATNGLDHLRDTEVIDRLHQAIDKFRAAVAGGGTIEQAEQNLSTIADEAVRRARHDRARFAAVLEARLGDRGPVALLGAVDALAAAPGRDPRRHGIPPAALDLAELLAPLSAAAPVCELIGAHLRSSTSLAPLIAVTSRAWDPTVLVELTSGLIRAIDERDYLLSRITPGELAGNVGALVDALVDDPAASLALLGDDLALDYLATDHYLDATSVEAIITAGMLHAPTAGGTVMGDGLDALARLVAISDDDQLNDGTKRGVAASMLRYFPLLAPQLDVRIPVVVPYGADPDDTVEIGSYCDVQRLFGQLLSDEPAQLVLGAMTERFRAAETAGLAAAIAARATDDPAGHRARIAAAMADVSAVTALIVRSRSARISLDAYEHGVVVGRAKSVISWATLMGAIAVPQTSVALMPVIPIASQVVTAALDLAEPARLPDLGVVAASAIGFTVSVIGIPTRAPRIRAELGLGSVPTATWRRLDELLEDLGDTDDQRRRLAIHSTIVSIAAEDPDLDVYVTQLEALGGDTANAGPQPPASCS